ncbi:MAG TPA: helix-turn-helix domain-containing protein [Polyangiaceae bacterium]|nr:helix-turn-helix domain-containing protein [Polyangiaceae bacterium]
MTDRQVERITSALAEPRRFRILKELASRNGEMSCAQIVDTHGVSNATISHHLKELETVELISIVREGKCNTIVLRRDVWKAYLARLAEV